MSFRSLTIITLLFIYYFLINYHQTHELASKKWATNIDEIIYDDSTIGDWYYDTKSLPTKHVKQKLVNIENFESSLVNLKARTEKNQHDKKKAKNKRNDSKQSSSESTSLSSLNVLNKCQTMATNIELNKDEYSSNGELIRRCRGTALVAKCEGACISNLRPSINAITGLLKVLSLKVYF